MTFPNLAQNSLVNSQFIPVNYLLLNKCFSFAMVYGANTYSVRRLLWRDLSFFIGPWCIYGDFNVVLSADDCNGGVAPNQVSCNELLDGLIIIILLVCLSLVLVILGVIGGEDIVILV